MECLKEFRSRWGLTQQEVSALLGVKQPAWNTWETGKRDVPEYVVKEISFFDRLNKREQQKEINRAKSESHVQQVDKLRDEWEGGNSDAEWHKKTSRCHYS